MENSRSIFGVFLCFCLEPFVHQNLYRTYKNSFILIIKIVLIYIFSYSFKHKQLFAGLQPNVIVDKLCKT